MRHNVYATMIVPTELTEEDGGTSLHADLLDKITREFGGSAGDFEVEVLDGRDFEQTEIPGGHDPVEINFWSTDDARSIAARIESILDSYEPVDTLVSVD